MEFCPKDFEDHMLVFNKTLQEIITERAAKMGAEYFGTGEFKVDRFEEIIPTPLVSGFPLWCIDGHWYFNSIQFTEEQNENQRLAIGAAQTDTLYEEIQAA